MEKTRRIIGQKRHAKAVFLNEFSEKSEVFILKAACRSVNRAIRASNENRTILQADGIYSIDSEGNKKLLKAGDFAPVKVSKRHYVVD